MTRTAQTARIIAERMHGDWMAWFGDASEMACGGEWPAQAIESLPKAHPDRGARGYQLSPIEETSHEGHPEFVVPVEANACPDCKGSGRYVGLNAVEPCRACGGSGLCDIPF